ITEGDAGCGGSGGWPSRIVDVIPGPTLTHCCFKLQKRTMPSKSTTLAKSLLNGGPDGTGAPVARSAAEACDSTWATSFDIASASVWPSGDFWKSGLFTSAEPKSVL